MRCLGMIGLPPTWRIATQFLLLWEVDLDSLVNYVFTFVSSHCILGLALLNH